MAVKADEINEILKRQIAGYVDEIESTNVGSVVDVGDGIAHVYGLQKALYNELIEFREAIDEATGEPVMGLASNLEEDSVGVVVLGDYAKITEGMEARSTGRVVEVPVGDALLGRIVDPLGRPLDGKGLISADKHRPVERLAPGVVVREPVNTPVQTGIKAIDSMIPIGRGQRELIIGDRQTGKTAIALDTIVNQKGKQLLCIYVAIGQKQSKVAEIAATLDRFGALEYTIIVSATAAESAALQWLAPYAGCAMGEEFMETGRDALVVYDDLTKHAQAYRQISLLLRRPPGREAFPGDVFFLHSRLLERAAKLNQEHGGGSLTALPVIETQAGDVTAYIPTNVISITDGQIYLESDLFYAGIRPALNVGTSVSRVGGAAQTRAMRKVAGALRLDLSQYRELAAFAQFGSDLDRATQARLERGRRVTEVLKQPQFRPLSLAREVMIIYAAVNGHLDNVPGDKITQWETDFYRFIEASHPDIARRIEETKDLSEEDTRALTEAIEEFNQTTQLGNE